MNWREQGWELIVFTFSWLVALVLFAGILAFVLAVGIKQQRERRRGQP